MPTSTRTIPTAIVLAVVTMLMVGSSLTLGAAPRPVIPVESLGDSVAGPSTDALSEMEREQQANQCHVGGSSGRGGGMVLATAGAGGFLVAPRPVLPVGLFPQPESPCQTRLSLDLTVESRAGREPDGADATIEELAVPRNVLESGFQTTFPAKSRALGLSDPGEEWEVKETSCACGGETATRAPVLVDQIGLPAAGTANGYPTPVIPIGSLGGGSITCPAPNPATPSPTAVDLPLGGSQPGTSLLTGAPRPVIPVKSLLPKDAPAEPDAPELTPARVSWDRSGNVRISDPDRAGADVACRWTVEHVYGRATVKTVTEPSGREAAFRYQLTPTTAGSGRVPQLFEGSAAGDERKVRHDAWTLEARDPGPAWRLQDSRCSEADGETPSGAQGTTAQVGVDAGDRVECTFRWKLAAPRAGRWKGVNQPGKATCSSSDGSVTLPLERATDFARFVVRKGGDRVVMRGQGGDSITITVDRDHADPLRYTGTANRTFEGMKAKWSYDLELIDDKRMKGTVSMTAKGKGNTCVFQRKLALSYAGG